MTLSTYDGHIWSATAYYTIDKNLNLYFISPPKAEHSTAIENNPEVACAIFDSTQKLTDKKKGMYLRGNAKQVRGIKAMKVALKMWTKQNPGFEDIINYGNIAKNKIRSKVYKIEPVRIKHFNEELYGDKEEEVLELN